MRSKLYFGWALASAAIATLTACSSNENNAAPSAGGSAGSGGTVDPGKGGVLFTVSGEDLAQSGYVFPPANPDDAHFYDGWNVEFDRLLVTFDKIVLSANPDKVPGDQSQTDAVVAEVTGPFAVDLHHDDPSYLTGKSGGAERAIPIATLTTQKDGTPFATDGTRYAFGFDTVAATAQAQKVNLDAAALADYQTMVTDGCVVLYAGTATFKGNKTDPGCYPDDRKTWPDTVKFHLCFKSPTTYANCQNPDSMGTPFPHEEFQRGIAFLADDKVVAQVTFHTDHPFWDSVLHDSPAHFDQFAARVVGQDGGIPTATLEATKGVDYTAFTDGAGKAIDWRYCSEPPTDVHPKLTGPMAFDPGTVPHAVGMDAKSGLRDYYDFATYNQSTQGHLNADGLCFVKRNYDSPQ